MKKAKKQSRVRLISRHRLRSLRPLEEQPRILQCARCKALFADYLARCPECGSEDWSGLSEVNPYARLPLESILRLCGHLLWLVSVAAFLACLWQTGEGESVADWMALALLALASGMLGSVAFFGMSEILRRLLRVQRRLKAFHEHYRELSPGSKESRNVLRTSPGR